MFKNVMGITDMAFGGHWTGLLYWLGIEARQCSRASFSPGSRHYIVRPGRFERRSKALAFEMVKWRCR